MKVTIADSLFLPDCRAAKMAAGNKDVPPSFFEWELAGSAIACFVTDSDIKYARGRAQVALLLEPFFLHPENYLEALKKPFDAVLTHNAWFAQNYGWLLYPPGGSHIPLENWGLHEKTGNVSILLSPKRTMPGHHLFHAVVEVFGSRFDRVFGLDGFASKMDALAPYRFAVVAENERTESYFTEKLIDCLLVGTVPIYWGCPNIGEYFDPRGILWADNLDEIGKHLENISQGLYNSMLPAIRENLELARNYRILEDWIYLEYPYLFMKWNDRAGEGQ